MTDRRLYALAGLLVASGLVHLVVWLVLGGPWTGPVSWRKPFTFGLAFGVTLATVTWVTSYLPLRARRALLAVFAAAWRRRGRGDHRAGLARGGILRTST